MKADYVGSIRRRREKERGPGFSEAPFRIALAYPSPYHTGMSSLGFLEIYKRLNAAPGLAAERFFLPDDADVVKGAWPVPLSYETLRPLSDFPVVALSVAYELEIAGVIQLLRAAGISPLREERGDRDPLIIAGGPLTFSNPLPLAPYVDAIVIGEADTRAVRLIQSLEGADRREALAELGKDPHVYLPERDGLDLPPVGKEDPAELPAYSSLRTPDTELSNMMLIEAERGCSRRCTYCVMRRSTNGGMRIVPQETILGLIPDDVERVGLVGAAVSDHPKITNIVNTLADRGIGVGLSSLRPDRLNDDFVAALKRGGYRTLTTAMDGPSERLRESLERKARIRHLEKAARLARDHRMKRLKLYLMIGLPTETDDDIDECIAFTTELAKTSSIALGIAPFCAKRNTPLDGEPFAGVDVVQKRLARLRKGLKGRAEIRSTSAKWAWVEYILAQGAHAEGRAVLEAVDAGGTYAAYKRAFANLPATQPRLTTAAPATEPTRRRLAIAPI